jgi:hypothetical protein
MSLMMWLRWVADEANTIMNENREAALAPRQRHLATSTQDQHTCVISSFIRKDIF